jgi:hypothetical protein
MWTGLRVGRRLKAGTPATAGTQFGALTARWVRDVRGRGKVHDGDPNGSKTKDEVERDVVGDTA